MLHDNDDWDDLIDSDFDDNDMLFDEPSEDDLRAIEEEEAKEAERLKYLKLQY